MGFVFFKLSLLGISFGSGLNILMIVLFNLFWMNLLKSLKRTSTRKISTTSSQTRSAN